MTRLRLAFMGTPGFSVPVLDALVAAGHEIACVYSQPPRPSGRGQAVRPGPVHARATALGLAVRTPARLKAAEDQQAFAALALDAAVVVAYGLILPKPILDAPRLGCLNVHASLLPRWRGAAPIQRAIMAGDTETGVMVMQMDEGLDTGPVLAERRLAIPPRATAGWLHDRLSLLGAELLPPTLADYAAGRIVPQPQSGAGITYAHKITAEETRLDWREAAAALDRRVRALSPAPGSWFEAPGGERIKVLETVPEGFSGAPGTVLDDSLTIACGSEALRLTRLQRAGKREMAAGELLRGWTLAAGTRLPLP